MKIRQGFVSNSSSSSFILCFDKEPKSHEDVKKVIFGDKEKFMACWSDKFLETEQASKVIFDNLENIKDAESYKKVAKDNWWSFTDEEVEEILSKCKKPFVYNFQCGNEVGGCYFTDLEGCDELRSYATYIESMH